MKPLSGVDDNARRCVCRETGGMARDLRQRHPYDRAYRATETDGRRVENRHCRRRAITLTVRQRSHPGTVIDSRSSRVRRGQPDCRTTGFFVRLRCCACNIPFSPSVDQLTNTSYLDAGEVVVEALGGVSRESTPVAGSGHGVSSQLVSQPYWVDQPNDRARHRPDGCIHYMTTRSCIPAC